MFLMAFIGLTLFSCSKKDKVDSSGAPHITAIPGFGDNQGAIPGTAFSLPQGIQLQGSITGENMSPVCKTAGFGTLVDVYLVLKNTTAAAIRVTFPAGLTLLSASTEDQNGIVAQNYEISIAAGIACTVKLGAYCINSSRHPAGSTSRYTWGPVCNAPAIVYLLNLLKDKDLDKDNDDGVQPSVWMVSADNTDPQSSKQTWNIVREFIAGIPNK
ncbi:hypothetical protein SAMN04487894_12716 [Niabella drilacis]|uniref:Uncharacterized protein n=2 Tax=Niabella drilacis (strain DSM 25811 / CCM 8410 / CCUG 62505 / LMG 26954 / E90) TaxID=1285928 RepID=A0A1G7B494_NIADE|nr:hypothetical protein SAMN04487894_12716 [Niabella drilacis]